jgi:hypothetical protein
MGFDAGDGNFFRYPYQPDQNQRQLGDDIDSKW